MKISKKRLANKVRKLEVQNYDMRQKIKKMDKALTYLDELTTDLNHALPDPEYDAWCEQNAVAVEESLARHAVRLGLVKQKLKQLDQSVFDGLDEKWQWATMSSVGIPFVYSYKPAGNRVWLSDSTAQEMIDAGRVMRIDEHGYDTTDWQNSLIERDKVELTGSDLCRAMLERGDKAVLCKAYDDEENDFYYDAITGCSDLHFDSCLTSWSCAIPINNQGEPLTASEVGL